MRIFLIEVDSVLKSLLSAFNHTQNSPVTLRGRANHDNYCFGDF